MKNLPYNISLRTWIIADTHFFHENIGRYCNRPKDWQALIIHNWNELISPDEQVLHLGDFAFGKKSNFENLVDQLNGRIILIRGNHDRMSVTSCENCGVILVNEPIVMKLENGYQIHFSHRPISPLPESVFNLHGHIHNNSSSLEDPRLGQNHINMSVEVREYRPWRLEDILAGISDISHN